MTKKTFAPTIRTGDDFPYVGVYDGEVTVDDFATLNPTVELISLHKMTKNTQQLPEFSALKYVSLNTVSADIIDALAKLPNLHMIKISSNRQEEWPSFNPLSQVKYLMLYNIKRLTSLDFLRSMTGLESLFLCEVLKVEDLSPLATLSNLKELNLEGDMHGRKNSVADASAIFELKKLEYLKLFTKNTKLNVSDFEALRALQYLHARKSYFPRGSADALAETLPAGCEIRIV